MQLAKLFSHSLSSYNPPRILRGSIFILVFTDQAPRSCLSCLFTVNCNCSRLTAHCSLLAAASGGLTVVVATIWLAPGWGEDSAAGAGGQAHSCWMRFPPSCRWLFSGDSPAPSRVGLWFSGPHIQLPTPVSFFSNAICQGEVR